MRQKNLFRALLTLVLAGTLAACGMTTTERGSIAEVASEDGNFTILLAALTEAGLASTFADDAAGPFTVFAPTDAAFEALLVELDLTAAELLASPDLADILLYHVVPGTFLAADVIAASPFDAPTLEGSTIAVEIVDGGVVLNGSVNVIITDVKAVNGVIHAIDFVLLPPTP